MFTDNQVIALEQMMNKTLEHLPVGYVIGVFVGNDKVQTILTLPHENVSFSTNSIPVGEQIASLIKRAEHHSLHSFSLPKESE